MLNFAVSVLLAKTDLVNDCSTAGHLLHTGAYIDKNAAVGAATLIALKEKPDFTVAGVVACEVKFSGKE